MTRHLPPPAPPPARGRHRPLAGKERRRPLSPSTTARPTTQRTLLRTRRGGTQEGRHPHTGSEGGRLAAGEETVRYEDSPRRRQSRVPRPSRWRACSPAPLVRGVRGGASAAATAAAVPRRCHWPRRRPLGRAPRRRTRRRARRRTRRRASPQPERVAAARAAAPPATSASRAEMMTEIAETTTTRHRVDRTSWAPPSRRPSGEPCAAARVRTWARARAGARRTRTRTRSSVLGPSRRGRGVHRASRRPRRRARSEAAPAQADCGSPAL